MKADFGDFTLDSDLRELIGPTGPLHLSPKAFDLLVLLVEERSKVHSKAELQERIWPDTFVAEANLAGLIAEIRAALGDDAQHPRFIRTAHRIGYGFCGPVTETRSAPGRASRRLTACWLLSDGRRIPLQVGDNLLGREPDEGITLDSPSVSRRHARISVGEGEATIEDLGSKNGTLLRGKRVTAPVPLRDGDDLKVGSVVLRFRRRSAAGSTMTLSDEDGQR